MPFEDAYLESQVLAADPLELLRLLYRAAVDAVRSAEIHLEAGRIAERSRQISKAHAILSHLSVSLDHERGAAYSRRLAELYDYMQRRLLEANLSQKLEPLAEVERLLDTLLKGWERAGTETPATAVRAGAPADTADLPDYTRYSAVFAPDSAAEYSSRSWSC